MPKSSNPRKVMKKRKTKTQLRPRRDLSDNFIAVARRLGADEDKATFEAKLGKIAKAKPTERQ